jgi:cysteine desulfurase
VLEAMLPFFSGHFGNAASRSHSFGWQAEEAVDIARNQVADVIGSHVQEVVFTSGATEAINLALKGVYETYSGRGRHIVTVATEHKAVIDTCAHLERIGAEVTYLGVKNNGTIDLAELEDALRSDTILVAVMYANNETGVINPVQKIGEIAKKRNVLFFCDATQAVGKLDVDVERDHIDLMSLSAHKLYGPKGAGALYVRRKNPRVKLTAQIDGGGHERGMRSGTLNVPGIVGLGKACEVAKEQLKPDAQRLSQLRNRLEEGLSTLGNVFVNGAGAERLPHVTNLSFAQVDGQALIGGLNKTMAISSGSACMSAAIEPSYVLKAMGVDDELAYGSIRFSLGRNNTEEEIEFIIEEVKSVVRTIRANKEKVES